MAMAMAPLSSQLLRSRRAVLEEGGDGGGGSRDDRARHSALNATWNGMGSKHLEAAEAHGAVRPKSVHEILARARATVAGSAPSNDILVQQKQPSQIQPDRLQKLESLEKSHETLTPAAASPGSAAGAKKRNQQSRPKDYAGSGEAAVATNEVSDVNDFVKRVESGALQSVQEKARARAERLVDQRDPRHGTKRKGASKALDAAAVNQQQMHQKVTKRLQERILTELKRIDNLCPEDPDDVAVTDSRRDENTAPVGAHGTRNPSRAAPADVEFLEATLRQLRTHHQRLNTMKSKSPVSRERSTGSKAGVPPRVAIVQPSQQRKQDANQVGSGSPQLSAVAGIDAATRRHAAARCIQYRYRVRLAVRKVRSRYEGKLRATRRELHKLRKVAQREKSNEPSPAAVQLTSATPMPALMEELEKLRAQVAEEKNRADAAEASILRWQESETDNLAQIAELREALHMMQRQVRSADVQAVEGDAHRCNEADRRSLDHSMALGAVNSGAVQPEPVERLYASSPKAGVGGLGHDDCSAFVDEGNAGEELPADVLQMLERSERSKVQASAGSC
jgi:hypothetical protein